MAKRIQNFKRKPSPTHIQIYAHNCT